MKLFLAAVSLLLCVLTSSVIEASAAHKAVLLSDVDSILLQRGAKTASQRTQPIPQLECIGGAAKGVYEPDQVLCKNMGWDGKQQLWKCEADMPSQYRLGAVRVSCEGYSSPGDKYILEGSCGLEYYLEYTGRTGTTHPTFDSTSFFESSSKHSSWTGSFFLLMIAAAIWYMLWKSNSPNEDIAQAPRYVDANADHPPAYHSSGAGSSSSWWGSGSNSGGAAFRAKAAPRSQTTTYTTTAAPAAASTAAPSQSTFAPGFWGGMLGGGLLGYLWNRRNNNTQPPVANAYQQPQSSYSAFGSRPQSTYPVHSPNRSPSRASSTHRSTAYGGTTVR